MNEQLIERIQREAGVPDLLEVLTERLAPTDLQSLLLEVHARLAGAVTTRRLLEQYRDNRFVAPAPLDPRVLVEVDRLAWALLPEGYVPLELAPVCPLGTNSVLASVHQHKVVSTDRNTEVVADSTNVLALECALRRRRLRQSPGQRPDSVPLAASHRLTRAQAFPGAHSWAHFRVLSLCAAGRDRGWLRFEAGQLVEQIAFYARLVAGMAQLGRELTKVRVAVTDFTDGGLTRVLEEQVLAPLAARLPDARCHLDPTRTAGRGYYEGFCFKLFATGASGEELELADGGVTPWLSRLLSDDKERLVISGLGVERLCGA